MRDFKKSSRTGRRLCWLTGLLTLTGAMLSLARAGIFPADLPLIVSMQSFPDRVAVGDPGVAAASGVEGPKGVAEGDLRGDGTPDDIAVSNLDGTVTVLFGSTGGDFEKLHLRTGASSLRGVIIADIDEDKRQDILTAAPFEGEVYVFRNLGNESFAAVDTIPQARAHGVRNLAAADFDGDGRVDLAIAGPGLGVRHLKGLGAGRFELAASMPQLSPVGVSFPKPVYALRPVPTLDGLRHDLVVMHAESDELFVLSSTGDSETESFDGRGGKQDLPVDTKETPLLITEFMAANTRTLADENGLYSDWIEIYNRSEGPVSLGGWFLANHYLFQDVWQFPNVIVEPGEFKLVFASGWDRRGAGSEWHASFKLSANDDEEVEALSLWEGQERRQVFQVDSGNPHYPEQVPDISYGLAFNGKEQFFQIPSPGRINNRGYDSLGEVSLTDIVAWVAEVSGTNVRISVQFSDISRLSSVWLASAQGTNRRYWAMQAVDRETSTTYTTSIPSRFYDAEAPLEVIARRKDGKISPVTVDLERDRAPSAGALRLVASLAARSARSLDVGRLLTLRDAEKSPVDLVLVNRDAGYIQIHRGVPERHRFDPNPYASFQVGGAPRAVRIGDVNGDGWNDLLVALRNADKLIVLRNEEGEGGQRTFVSDSTLEIPVGASPRGIAVVDANQDGKEDALVINRFSSDLSVVLTVEDDATFGKLDHLYPVDGQTAALTLLDFDHDGRDDVVLTHRATGDFSVRLSRADGSLGPPQYFAAGEEPNDTEFEDCDEDGDEDAIVALLNGQASIVVRLREPDGSFGPLTTYNAPKEVGVGDLLCVATADFDGDGHTDIAASYFDCRLTFFRGDGRGAFEATPVNDFTDEPRDIIPGDFDGDGDADLATVNFSGEVVILENLAGRIMEYSDWEFAMAKRVFRTADDETGLHIDARDVRKVDLNGDDFDDLIAATGNGVRYLLGRPVIADMQVVSALGEAVAAMARGDFDGNGVDDVAVACKERSCVKFLAMENGVLREQASVAVPGARFLAQGDLDGDGEPDLVGVGDVLWTALSSRSPRPAEEVDELVQRPVLKKLVINEILARNNGIPLLFDRDTEADYVELYNGASTAVSLKGWRLDLVEPGEKLKSYAFPSESIQPGSHHLVVFSNTPRTVHHTGFKLPGDGATLRLRDAERAVVDEVRYPFQLDNIAYSRYRDGLSAFIFNPLPTPNTPNRDGGAVEPRLAFRGFDASSVQAGEPLRFTAEADDDVGIVSVWVTFLRLDRPADGLQKLVLFDTGMHGDGERGDGIYSNAMDRPLTADSEVHFYLSAMDLTGSVVTYPDEPVLALDGRSEDVLSIGVGAPLDLAITEVVSSNGSLLEDSHPGLDYVEITNRGRESISLEGVSLADRFLIGPGDSFDFPPQTVLLPGESVLVFAGEEEIGGEYVAPFGISSANGDRLVLMGTALGGARTVIDAVDVPPLERDTAYYRVGDVWLKGSATPGEQNPPPESDEFHAFDRRGQLVWTKVFHAETGVRYEVTVRHPEGGVRVVNEIEGMGTLISVSLAPGEEGEWSVIAIPPVPPSFEWEVTGVTKRTAEISGRILDTGGRPPELKLYYDEEDRGVRSVDWAHHQALPGREDDRIHVVLRDLIPGRRYVARLQADNGSEPVWSPAVPFQTLPESLPLVAVPSVDEITTIDAQCEVEIEEAGRLPAEVTVFWGATDGGVNPEQWQFSQVLGEGRVFETELEGLTPGQVHYVRARAANEDGETWSPESLAFTAMSVLDALKQYLIVSEFMYHPVGPTSQEAAFGYRNSDFEWLELHNHGPVPLDLADVSLRNAISFDFAFDGDVTTIEPQGFLTIAANREAFALRYGDEVPVAGQWCGPFSCPQLSNDGIRSNGEEDTIVLAYRSSVTLLEISYRGDGLWPEGPDGKGVSLEVSPPGTVSPFDVWHNRNWSQPVAWQASGFIGGTPGSSAPPGAFDPTVVPLREGLHVTRLGPFGDEEFIELTNLSDRPLDLTRVRIDDDIHFSFAGALIKELGVGESVYVVRDEIAFRSAYGGGLAVAGEFDRKLSADGRLVITAAGVSLIEFISPFTTEPLAGRGRVYRVVAPVVGLDLNLPESWTAVDYFDKAVPWFGLEGGRRFFTFDINMVDFDLALAGETIYYTLDQSLPGPENGQVYTEPFNLEQSAILFARMGEGPVQTTAYLRQDVRVQSRGLPLLLIDTIGKALGSEPVGGALSVDEWTSYAEVALEGEEAVKPSFRFRIRDALGDEVPRAIFDLPADSEWLLKAPESRDLSLLREALAYRLSREMGLWAPRTEFVEVYLNQDGGAVDEPDYFGVYLLTETLKRGSHRVDVEELAPDATQLPGITGGYLFRKLPTGPADAIERLYPPEGEALRESQEQWLKQFLTDLSSAVASPALRTGYPAYIDVESWVDYHLLHVLMGHAAGLRENAYFHKKRSADRALPGRLRAGPPWDFAATAGSPMAAVQGYHLWSPEEAEASFFRQGSNGGLPEWWHRLFEQPDFQQAWVDRWHHLRRSTFGLNHIQEILDDMTSALDEAPERNFRRWPELAEASLFGPVGEVDGLRYWLEGRLRWVDRQLIPPPSIHPGEREHDRSVTIHLERPTGAGDSGEVFFTTDGTDPRLPGGGLSSQARFQSSFEAASSTTVIARMRNRDHVTARGGPKQEWSAPIRTRFYIGSSAPDKESFRVSEIMFHPPAPSPEEHQEGFEDDDDFEFVEFWNSTDKPIDLTGVRVSGAVGFTFPEGVTVAAGEHAVLVKNAAAFRFRYGDAPRLLGEYDEGTLSNKEDSLTVTSLEGDTLFVVTYDDSLDPSDGDGFSLTRETNDSDWMESGSLGGSPGEADHLLGLPRFYLQWIREVFPPTAQNDLNDVSWDADPDGDGMQNHAEFAFATDPLRANAFPVTVKMIWGTPRLEVTAQLEVTHPAAWAGVEYQLEISSDLQTWQPASSVVVYLEVSPDGQGLQYCYRLGSLSFQPLGRDLFVRVRYSMWP